MTKQIFAFLFCFTRELNPYTPLTFSLCLPIHPYITHQSPTHPPILTLTLRPPPIHPFLKLTHPPIHPFLNTLKIPL